ncbi:MAG TPA: histidine phosphatase family protein [Allosphingosinicella sp.]|jgi:phosphohistidine phosphatase SixA
MKLFHIAAGMMLALAAACATTQQEAAGTDYYVMRHLQKGEGTDPGLSQEGQVQAERLATWFGKNRPTAIYVSTTRRARETAAALAARLGLTAKEYNPTDTAGLVQRLLAEKGTVLVVGHSNTVPEIVERLGGARPAPIAETEYGDIWLVAGGEPRRTQKLKL